MRQFFSQALISISCVLFLFSCNTTLEADKAFQADSYYASGIQADRGLNDGDDGACFAADTLVMMADGSNRRIIDIRVGDRVKSYDIESRKMMDTDVIRIRNGFAGYHYIINGGLKVTPPHPFCTPDGRWVKIKDLREGQTVRVSSSVGKISSIEHKIVGQRIYNINVRDNHNFFVSGDGKDFFLVKEWR